MKVVLFLGVLVQVTAVCAAPHEVSFPDADSVARHVKSRDGGPKPKFLSSGTLELPAPFSEFRKNRVRWTFDFHEDMRFAQGIEFDLFCSDCTCFSGFSLYFNTGSGSYTGEFVPLKEGEWHRVKVLKSHFGRTEGKVSGWKNVRAFTLAGWRAGTRDSLFRIRNIRVLKEVSDIVVVRGDCSEIKDPSKGYVSSSARMLKMLESMGMKVCEISDLELDAAALEGVRLAVLPWNSDMPPDALKALQKFSSSGGKIFACYSSGAEVGKILGVKGRFLHLSMRPGGRSCARMRRQGAGLPGQPELVTHPTACITQAGIVGKGEVLAVWEDRDGGGDRHPALIKTPAGYFMAHVWKNVGAEGFALMKSILLDVNPAWRSGIELAERAVAEEMAKESQWVASRQPKEGEWRGIGCHTPEGPSGYTWDEAARLVKESGFTALVPNVASTGKIYRKEAMECLQACRKYGLECWFWKVCLHPHRKRAAVFPGRCQVKFDGSELKRWMCPSDPRNVASEVDEFVELAKMGPHGISIDYARYPWGLDNCYCDGCKEAFERRFSLKVANWPKDVRSSRDLADRWTDFRCDTISSFLREIARRVRKECPEVKIKTSCFHHEVEESRRMVGQDWIAWCKEGLIDVISPMNYYTGDSVFAFKGLVKSQVEALRGTKVRVFPGIGVSCWKTTGHDGKRMCEQIEAIREAGLGGFGVFELDARGIAVMPELKRGILGR